LAIAFHYWGIAGVAGGFCSLQGEGIRRVEPVKN
jgi:hypothetical protein